MVMLEIIRIEKRLQVQATRGSAITQRSKKETRMSLFTYSIPLYEYANNEPLIKIGGAL